jgi:dihydroorotate dehydrogenase electron transfer subunit
VHIRCNPDIPMRRPLSIMRASAGEGWIEVLYKVVGHGLAALSRVEPGELVNLLGPVGRGFRPDPARPKAVLIGGGVGIPPLFFLATTLAPQPPAVAFLGSESPFPFAPASSAFMLPGVPDSADGCMPQLEALGIASRLASKTGLPGSFSGYVTDLARAWLATRNPAELSAMTIYACGPTPMLRSVKELAAGFGLPSQLCVEEFMACAVGGCAGCVMPVMIDGQRQMKRVCVDGPVFDGAALFVDRG